MVFAGKVFQQIIGIPMGTNCASLLADIFMYSYEAEFIQSVLSTGRKRLASQFNFTYRYIDDALCINNPDFENYLGQMYPPELEIKDTTESNTSASYLDLLLSIGRNGQLHTSFYDKRDDFNFHITNFLPRVATSHLRPPMAFISHKSSDTPGLASLMNVLFWGRCDFPISFSVRDMSRNVWNRLLGSSMVSTGILSNNMRSPSPECYTTFWRWPYTVTPFIDETLHQFWPFTDLDLITEFDFLPNYVRFP